MEAVLIPRLVHLEDRTETIAFDEFLLDLKTLTPARGVASVIHRGNYIDLAVKGEGIITLGCHRCLCQYNHRLEIDAKEMIWLRDAPIDVSAIPFDQDITTDDLMETISSEGLYDLTTWVYEQFCMAIPQRQLCSLTCDGIVVAKTEPESVDRRWKGLASLRDQLPE